MFSVQRSILLLVLVLLLLVQLLLLLILLLLSCDIGIIINTGTGTGTGTTDDRGVHFYDDFTNTKLESIKAPRDLGPLASSSHAAEFTGIIIIVITIIIIIIIIFIIIVIIRTNKRGSCTLIARYV